MKKFETEVHLSREMSLLDATMIGVGAMIGAGIFVLTGIAAGVAGPALIIAFALNGLVALLTAMSYAELGSCFHDAGGGYLWVKEGLPKWNGFLSGWMSWFAHAVACSLYALGFGAYFDHTLREFGVIMPEWGFFSQQKILAVVIAVVFAYINFRGASETGKVGNLVTLTKIVILMIFVAFGLQVTFGKTNWQGAFTPFFSNGWDGIVRAMGLTFIAFQGFEVISQCSEEIRNPKKNIPRAVFLSLLIVVPIYLLIAFTALGSVAPEGMTPWDYLALQKETALVEVAKTFFRGGGIMLIFGGLISTMSALNATVYSSSRVAFAMGRDRNFPSIFSKVHESRFTPHMAIVFSLIIVVLMSISLHIEDVASAADIMFLLLFLQVNITLIRLRKKRPDLDRGFMTPLFPYLTIVGIALLFFLAVFMLTYSPLGWLVTACWIGLGLIVYRTYAADREIEHARKVRALEALERKEYRILVSIANPRTAPALAEIAVGIAKKHQGRILLLHVIEVEEGHALASGVQAQERILPLLETTETLVQKHGVPVRSMVSLARRISHGIVETAEKEDCNFILLGRPKELTFTDRLFTSVIDSVIQDSPCEVAVLHGILPPPQDIKRILVPYGENIHSRLALETVPGISAQFRSAVRVATVFAPETPAGTIAQQTARIQDLMESSGLEAEIATIPHGDIVHGLVQESAKADLVVMGGRRGEVLELLFTQSLTQEITEALKCPVLWVIEYEEQPSFWASAFRSYRREKHHG